MAISSPVGDWVNQLQAKYGDRRRPAYEREKATVGQYLQALVEKLIENYDLQRPLAVGGTGIVFVGMHRRLSQQVVVKFNRPNLPEGETSMVEVESSVLPLLNHPHIVRILDAGQVQGQQPILTYLVEPFVAGSRPFFTCDPDKIDDTWLKKRLDEVRQKLPAEPPDTRAEDPGPASELVNAVLADLSSLFAQWVGLLDHLHSLRSREGRSYVHLDVKPDNVLVDEHLHLTSIDYGSVQYLDPDDNSPIEVFFTERYAHKFLVDRKREKASSNRVRGSVKRCDLRAEFDYYSLGISMLEILNEVAKVREHSVPQLPIYHSLHFLATRLLDGQNRQADNPYQFAPQLFPSLNEKDYLNLRYTNLLDAIRDLEKERGRWNLEDRVPELATYSKDIVRVVAGFNTVFTSRLKSLIEHPIFARLKYVTQLGLVSLVYPTADHSRFDHALGSYTYTTNYVKSLFNDLGNPIFRNLVSEQDLNAVLLASLLHDLGQYPLAHDLEEVHERIFKHTRIGTSLLGDPTKDSFGRTLGDIISEQKNGWGVPLELLNSILGAHSRHADARDKKNSNSLKVDVLGAIIDGPVDADKADYIIRDSARCELPYGSQLDVERLLRVLTVAIIPEQAKPMKRVTLGVYDKGATSAHAFGLARHQLLSTVYWHHTTRVAKAMLQYAAAMGLPRNVFGPMAVTEEKELEIREQLLEFVKRLVPPFDLPKDKGARRKDGDMPLDLTSQPPEEVGRTLSEERPRTGGKTGHVSFAAQGWYPGISWTDWLMLRWIAELPAATEKSRNLIEGLQTRVLYKRVATFSRAGSYDDIIPSLEQMEWPDRIDLCNGLHMLIQDVLKRDWQNLNTSAPLDEAGFDRLCESNLLILIDVPYPGKKIGYERPLGIVPELKEKSYQQDSRQATEDKQWRQTMQSMTEAIAPVRILCHPKVRNLVSAYLSPVEYRLAEMLRQIIKGG